MDLRRIYASKTITHGKPLSLDTLLSNHKDPMYSILKTVGNNRGNFATLNYAMYRGDTAIVKAVLREKPKLEPYEWSRIYHDKDYAGFKPDLRRHLQEEPEPFCQVS